MTRIMTIVIPMERIDILHIITWAGPIAAIIVMACAWYINKFDTRVLQHQLELQRLALLEETEQKKREAYRNAVSIDME
jgi:hypothetical protein